MDEKQRERLEDFLHRPEISKRLKRVVSTGQKSLVVEYDEIVKFDSALAKYLLNEPAKVFEEANRILEGISRVPGLRLRVKSLGESEDIRNLRSFHLGKFIQVEGIVVRASSVRPEIKIATFRCKRCGEEYRREQMGDYITSPIFCENPDCKARGAGAFEIVLESTEFRDWQSIQVQEPPAKLRGGRMPRRLDGIIRDDLVDVAVPGNNVVITGILQPLFNRKNEKVMRTVFLVNHVEVLQKGVEEAELTPEDMEQIKKLAKSPWIDHMIVQSIAPAIIGHETIKEAIALQLFGCDPLVLEDGTRIRGDVHILLTGEPGTAKSQILKWVAGVAPRGVYTSGKKTTGAGLTATAVRDELGSGWTLEAGALVIADGGLACIDEFEKMDVEERGTMLESMEQQTISVAKAGIVATLNARTAVLAATNPKWGRFDPTQSIALQLPLDPVLLSRFDLMFVLRDEPKVEDDHAIAKHILTLHTKPSKALKPPIDFELLRKMIIYARKSIRPQLTDKEAQRIITDFYVGWRKMMVAKGAPLPITVRQLEAIVRLAKARARLRFSDAVSVEDAKRATDLMKHCLEQVGVDVRTGLVDIDLITTGIPKSQRDSAVRVMQIIEELESEYGDKVPLKEVKTRAVGIGISESFVDQFIEREKARGTLYAPTDETIARVK
jgi:replicative DNA helicase Mcm